MRALRIEGKTTVHGTSRHVDFHFYAHTACGIRVDWRSGVDASVNLDSDDDDRLVIAQPTSDPVDCMTCLVRLVREQDKADSLTSPCD